MMRQTVRIKRTNLLMLSDDERRRRVDALSANGGSGGSGATFLRDQNSFIYVDENNSNQTNLPNLS